MVSVHATLRAFRVGPILARGGLLLGGLLCLLLAGELVLRGYARIDDSFGQRMWQLRDVGPTLVLTQWVPHPFLPFVGRPNADYRTNLGNWGIDMRVQNNSYGFRTHEFPTRKQPADYVVVCLGESTTWGAAAATNEATWPELLERRLAVRYPERNVRVYNLAAPTGTTVYSLAALALIGVHLHPDLIIVYHGFNEYGAMMVDNFKTDHSHHFRNFDPQTAWRGVRRNLPASLLNSYAITFASELLDDALQVNMMSYYLVHQNNPAERFPNRGVEATLRNLDTIRAIAVGEHADVLYSTFQYYDGPSYEQINRMLREYFVANGVWFVDQDALIPDFDRSINIDACHFTRKGDELMAQNFFDAIVARGSIPEVPGG